MFLAIAHSFLPDEVAYSSIHLICSSLQTIAYDPATRLADVCQNCSYLEPQLDRPADAATFARVGLLFDHKAVRGGCDALRR